MKKIFLTTLCLMVLCASYSQQKEWKLIWSDEFDQPGLPDSAKWLFETEGNAWGWGNNELQYYTDRKLSNAFISNGTLNIKVLQEKVVGKQYTSARISTAGKFDFTYGKVEVRAKLPGGVGIWPAIWMLGSSISHTKWPDCGEIDIMEHVGYIKDSIFGTVHTAAYNHVIGTQKGKTVFINQPYTAFHLYGIEWTSERIDFLMDGNVYYSITNEHKTEKEWPFDKPFYLILNVAVGGNFGGKMGVDDKIFPATMEVDYVRVYQ